VIFVATKKGRTTIFFPLLSFVAGFGSGMDKNRIRDKYPRSATLVSPGSGAVIKKIADLSFLLLQILQN
jgi:hypothetical protein